MLIDSEPWAIFLVEAYRQMNDAIKRKPHKIVEVALQAKIDILGLILAKLKQVEAQHNNGGGEMPVEYGDLIKKMVAVDELKSSTRRTQLTESILQFADAVRKSKEKGAIADSSKVKYPAFYRKVKQLQKAGELDKSFFVSKVGDDFGLGFSTNKD